MHLKKVIHSVLPPLLTIGYGAYLLWLFFSKKLFLFVQQNYIYLSLVSGLFLLFTGVVGMYHLVVELKRRREEDALDVTHEGSLYFVVLIIPLLLAFLVPLKPLSSATAALRSGGINTDAAYTAPQRNISMFDVDTTNRTIVDWIQLFTQDPEPDRYKGLKVKLDGFVLRDSSLPENYFLVSRFVISCCAADARPVGIPVHFDPAKWQLKNDDWVEVTGTLDAAEILQDRQPVVEAEKIQPIPVPDNPYAN